MKISKKIFLAAITAAAVAFVGCKMGEGDGKLSGSKWDATLTKDSTTVGVEEASPAYGRFFKQLGTGEKVQSIKTLITVCTKDIDGWVTEPEKGYYLVAEEGAEKATEVHGVVGLIFDLHETNAEADNEGVWKKGDTLYDFVIVGYRSSDKGFYVERYANIPEGSMDEFVTSSGFGTATDVITTGTDKAPYFVYDYKDQVSEVETEDGEPAHAFTVTVEQKEANKGTYTIKIGDKTVGTYKGLVNSEKDGSGYAIGGAGAYANAPVGTIVKATFESDKDATVGLFAEPVEE